MNEEEVMEKIAAKDKYLNPYDMGVYCIEEMSELIKELCKFKRDPNRSLDCIQEEIAHVLLTVEILSHSLNCVKKVKTEKQAKLSKLYIEAIQREKDTLELNWGLKRR
jgi:NTP pyrophosphatase (non-canonical NTP hydrolase)